MKHINILLTFVFIFSFSIPAYANHLGPIVFGEMRNELVTYCLSIDDATMFAKEEEKAIIAGKTVEQYAKLVKYLFIERRCNQNTVQYVPERTIYQWAGYHNNFGEPTKVGTVSIVRSTSRQKTVFYVITNDPTPPPAKPLEPGSEKDNKN